MFSLLLSPYLRYFIIAALVLVGILLVAGIGGIIYGIYEAVRTRRRPCLYSLITWGIALIGLILNFVIQALLSGSTWQVYFLGLFWDFWQTVLFGVIGLSFLSGSCVFVFQAFIRNDKERKMILSKEYPENDIVESVEDDAAESVEETGHDTEIQVETFESIENSIENNVESIVENSAEYAEGNHNATDTPDGKDQGTAKKKRRLASNLLPEILTIAVTVVLTLVLVVFLKFWSFLSDIHMVTKIISPDGQHEIIVDNTSWLFFENTYVYERENLFFAKRLPEANGTSVQHIDVDAETVEWTDESVLFPFGHTYFQYNFSDTESE